MDQKIQSTIDFAEAVIAQAKEGVAKVERGILQLKEVQAALSSAAESARLASIHEERLALALEIAECKAAMGRAA